MKRGEEILTRIIYIIDPIYKLYNLIRLSPDLFPTPRHHDRLAGQNTQRTTRTFDLFTPYYSPTYVNKNHLLSWVHPTQAEPQSPGRQPVKKISIEKEISSDEYPSEPECDH